jgi:hypothetical protein
MRRIIGIGLALAIVGVLVVGGVASAQGPYPNTQLYGYGGYAYYGGAYGIPPSVYGGYYGGVRGGFYSGPYYCYHEPFRGVGHDVYYYRSGRYMFKEYTCHGCPWSGYYAEQTPPPPPPTP